MDTTISNVEYQEPEKRILVTVSYGEVQRNGTWHRAKVSVFIDWDGFIRGNQTSGD